ncbi:hypothetical protein MRB53_040149 [Persea americana]|nr:hypothetical protein MRB53_040149 [Persea americana]
MNMMISAVKLMDNVMLVMTVVPANVGVYSPDVDSPLANCTLYAQGVARSLDHILYQIQLNSRCLNSRYEHLSQICFYWILDTTRRRLVHLTLVVCTAGLSIGSEFIQGVLPDNGREFDPLDIMANVLGSVAALLLCSWYHKRMLERKRQNKHYDIVPGDDLGDGERDVELGEGIEAQETGVIHSDTHAGAVDDGKKTVTEELDGWDENAEDWDDDADGNADTKTDDLKKRAD